MSGFVKLTLSVPIEGFCYQIFKASLPKAAGGDMDPELNPYIKFSSF